MGTVTVVAILAALVATVAEGGRRGSANAQSIQAYKGYEDALKKAGFSNDIPIEDIITQLSLRGNLDVSKHEDILNKIKDTQNAFGDGISMSDIWYALGHTPSTHKKIAALLEDMSSAMPALKYGLYEGTELQPESVRESFYSSVPSIGDAPAPAYFDPSSIETQQFDVDDLHLWSGQELADLHDIEYNPDVYYDEIKQATQAAKDYAYWQSDYANQASMQNDTTDKTSYLDSLRNTKSDAITAGISAGQRAANEVLANTEALGAYAMDQQAVADERMGIVEQAIADDAAAKLTARNYFDQLAKGFSGDASILYQNDVNKRGQQLLSNAEMYTADQTLRGLYEYNNAEMFRNYAIAQSAINGYKSQANSQADQFKWVFDALYARNNGDLNRTITEMDKYIYNQYTGFNNIVAMSNNKRLNN